MKKLMLATVVTLASVSALASKARLNSLQNAEHIVDIQEVFVDEPDQAVNYEAATVEFGGALGTSPEAEGGFIRKMGDSAWALYLGRSSTTFQTLTNAVTPGLGTTTDEDTVLAQAAVQGNPLQLTYATKMGDIAMGANLFYVSQDVKNNTFTSSAESMTGDVKQTVAGLLFGANNGVWDAQARVGLAGRTEIENITASTLAAVGAGADLDIQSTGSYKVSGGYRMDTLYYYGSFEAGSSEVELTGNRIADIKSNTTTVGVINSLKKEGTDFFYGASVVYSYAEDDGSSATIKKLTTRTVPLLVGVESEINTWLTLRGSISQNLGPLSTRHVSGFDEGTSVDNTVTRLGAGFKWGRAMIDTTIGTGSTGTFGLDDDGDNFAQASVTYNF